MKRHPAEEIIPKLRQAEADLAQGLALAQLCQRLAVGEPTLHRWRNQYGGLKQDEAKRLKELEAENARLRRLVADLALDQQMFPEVAPESGDRPATEAGGAFPPGALRRLRTPGLPRAGAAALDTVAAAQSCRN